MAIMKRVMVCVGLMAGFLTAPAWCDYKTVYTPQPGDAMQVHIFELANGLRIYLTENHEEPRFYSEIAVRAGSKHDPSETTGLAHYLEHLLFKGTQKMGTLDYAAEKPHLDRIQALYEQHYTEADPEKRKAIYAEINSEAQKSAQFAVPNEMDKLYKAMGGTGLNAHTWVEETVYRVNLPSNRLAQWAAIESERFVNPVFRLFHTELETVYEEKNRSMDNKDRAISEAVEKLLYKKHPYGQQTTLGEVEHLKRPSLVNIRNYFDTYYVPNNMAIAISGDIQIEPTIQLLDKAFGPWKPRDLPEPTTWVEAPIQDVERVTVQFQGEEYVLIGFRTVSQNHPDAEPLQLLDMILDNSVAGLINLNLNQRQLVRQAGSHPYQYNDYGAQYLHGVPKDGQTLEDVEKLLLEQVAMIKKGEFEDWIIPAIINDFKKSQKAQFESNEARVNMLRDSFLSFQSWEHTLGRIGRMEKLTKQDVVRVANEYFSGGYVVGYRRDAQHEVPKIEKPQIDPIAIDPTRASPFFHEIMAMPIQPLEPYFIEPGRDYQQASTQGGRAFTYVHNPFNDLFGLTLRVEKGSDHDNRLGIAAQLLNKAGAGALSAEDLKKEWYKLGSDFSLGVGDNETYINLSGLDENFNQSVDLMAELLRHPVADQATLDTLINIILISREDAKKQAPAISSALIEYNRHGKDSSYLRMLPSAEVKALNVAELFERVTQLTGYRFHVTYTGSLPAEAVMAKIDAAFPVSGTPLDPPAPVHYAVRTPEKTELLFFNKETAQSIVQIDSAGKRYDEALSAPAQLFNNYFGGGMGGLVFQEMREARALAYSVRGYYARAGRKGEEDLFAASLGTQNDKTPDALSAFMELIDTMPESPERFTNAKDSLMELYRSTRLGFREIPGAIRTWELLGLEPDPRKARYEFICSAGFDSVLDFYKANIQGKPKLISVVGDPSKFDLESIKTHGEIREVTLDEIFVN
ncbi:MAG: zinc protease [Candidatus Hydrogenedentota bacterium]